MEAPKEPRAVYEEHHRARLEDFKNANAHADRLGNVRLLLAVVGLILVLMPLISRDSWPWWSLIPLGLVFAVLGRALERAFEKRRRLQGSVRFYEAGIERLEERWRVFEDTGRGLVRTSPMHYAGDLDLFGEASLFQLLSRASTEEGRRTLARWLSAPESTEEIEARQAAVAELGPLLQFRESLLTAANQEEMRPVDDRKLLEWAEKSEPLPAQGLLRALGIIQPVIFAITAGLYLFADLRAPVVIASILQLITLFAARRATAPRAAVLSGPERALKRYASLIEVIEGQAFSSPRLKKIQEALAVDGAPASKQIRSLTRLVDLLDARLNLFFALSIGPATLWELNLVLAAERWRARLGPSLRGWFQAIGELEALCSFASLYYERPDYSMPKIVGEEASFEAEGLAHPLIDRRMVKSNDLKLGGAGSLLLLSGSNMSGKSTLLRSVGINLVLARAGAPVAARRLECSMMELATSVRVVDSLASGTSHFYAELQRLKHIVDTAQQAKGRVVYLLDEVLHGTNSRERYIGAVSVIKHLAQVGAMGIVTTHDLALARVAAELGEGQAINKHFSDDLVDGEMHFDYQLRDGPIRSTNALRLMRAVGLELDFDAVKVES